MSFIKKILTFLLNVDSAMVMTNVSLEAVFKMLYIYNPSHCLILYKMCIRKICKQNLMSPNNFFSSSYFHIIEKKQQLVGLCQIYSYFLFVLVIINDNI